MWRLVLSSGKLSWEQDEWGCSLAIFALIPGILSGWFLSRSLVSVIVKTQGLNHILSCVVGLLGRSEYSFISCHIWYLLHLSSERYGTFYLQYIELERKANTKGMKGTWNCQNSAHQISGKASTLWMDEGLASLDQESASLSHKWPDRKYFNLCRTYAMSIVFVFLKHCFITLNTFKNHS